MNTLGIPGFLSVFAGALLSPGTIPWSLWLKRGQETGKPPGICRPPRPMAAETLRVSKTPQPLMEGSGVLQGFA